MDSHGDKDVDAYPVQPWKDDRFRWAAFEDFEGI